MKPVVSNLAVVTSCHNYGRYLDDWSNSIVVMNRWPGCVVLVDNGSTDGTWASMELVANKLRNAGISDVRMERIPLTDFGSARNKAVDRAGDAEWVMHMDADDMFMVHCLDDVAPLMPKADVIPLGYQRTGDLASGPRNRTRVYSTTRGKQTLQSTAPASGVSPFRKALWEKSPYRTDMIGGWDTALWIGFAHMNARFVAVRRPCFYYRQHADSIFNVRRNDARTSRIVGAKLGNLRRQRKGVSVLVPRRSDGGGARDNTWAWVKERYAKLNPEWEVVEGTCDPNGPWRKGAAIRSAYEASHGNTLIIADSDCFFAQGTLEEAVALVEAGDAPWVIPHTLVKRLNRAATACILESSPASAPLNVDGEFDRAPYVGFAGGGAIVIDASAWAGAGGMPTSFAGWGAEDEATAEILDTLVGPNVRLENDLFHLWHPHARRTGGQVYHHHNRSLLSLIRSLAGDADAMFNALVQLESGNPLDAVLAGNSGAGVLMVAIEDFNRGKQKIKKHDRFIATEDEARRHDARPRRIAMRVSNAPVGILKGGRNQTLALRSEQHMRNAAAKGAVRRVTIKEA